MFHFFHFQNARPPLYTCPSPTCAGPGHLYKNGVEYSRAPPHDVGAAGGPQPSWKRVWLSVTIWWGHMGHPLTLLPKSVSKEGKSFKRKTSYSIHPGPAPVWVRSPGGIRHKRLPKPLCVPGSAMYLPPHSSKGKLKPTLVLMIMRHAGCPLFLYGPGTNTRQCRFLK